MSRAAREFAVDKAKMDRLLEKRGLSYSEVAREMGRSPKYLSNKVRVDGYISLPDARFLKVIYGITEDEYAPDPEPMKENKIDIPEIPVEDLVDVPAYEIELQIDYDKLHNVIFDAVYQAVKKAWAE